MFFQVLTEDTRTGLNFIIVLKIKPYQNNNEYVKTASMEVLIVTFFVVFE